MNAPEDPTTPEPNTPEPTTPENDAETLPHDPPSGRESSKAAVSPPLPDTLGNYRILGEIGRGGMGSVYAAVRVDDNFKKRVAIKVMRAGLDTDDMLTRFELERQVLAAINHPNIARVFDAGSTPDNRPYIVMELVQGKPIDRYCDDNNLTLQQRLELFAKVCAAVHHAHQNLVVHRDIKPANILVTQSGEPKLLDFGIAKLLNPELSALDPMTRADQRLLTYEYASPEQVTGEPITTASDVYALGVLLYELLTGHRPYELTRRVHEEALRVICSTEPKRPSTAVSSSITVKGPGDSTKTITGEEIARRREMQLSRLRKRLSGDLDNIVLKAMRKTPGRRYLSAEDLAADITRHLTGQTVNARPPTWDYRAGKFIRRHRTAVAAAALITLTLVTGLAATAWQWREADTARTIAEDRYQQLRQLTQVFDDIEADITELEGATAARTVIADALVRTLATLADAAEADDQLTLDLAAGYRRAGAIAGREGGIAANSLDHLQQADHLLAALPADFPGRAGEQARVDLELARALALAGDPEEASTRARAAANHTITAPTPGPQTLTTIEALEVIARLQLATGDLQTARITAKEATDFALAARERNPDAPAATEALSIAFEITGRVEAAAREPAAIAAYDRAIAERQTLADGTVRTAEHTRRLMALHERRGRVHAANVDQDAALADFDRARALAERRLEADPFSGRAFEDLARTYENTGDLWYNARERERALPLYEAFLERSLAAADRDPLSRQRQRMVVLAHKKIADSLRNLRRRADAVDAYADALAALIPLLDADPENREYRFDELWIAAYGGRELARLDRELEAVRLWQRGIDAAAVLEQSETRWGRPEQGLTSLCVRGLANIALDEGDHATAIQLFARGQTLRPSTSVSLLANEARAHRLADDPDGERDRLRALIEAVNAAENTSEAAAEARTAAQQRLAEIEG